MFKGRPGDGPRSNKPQVCLSNFLKRGTPAVNCIETVCFRGGQGADARSSVKSCLPAVSVNAAGKSTKAAADERTGRTAAASNRAEARTKKRTARRAAQGTLLSPVHIGSADAGENQHTGQQKGRKSFHFLLLLLLQE